MQILRRTHLALSLVLLTAVACGSGDSPTPAAAPSTTEATLPPTTVAPKPTVTLDFAGAEPRKPLALRLAAGTTNKVAMVNTLGMTLTIDGQAVPGAVLPGTKTVMEERVERVDADGTAHYSTTFIDVSVVPTRGADPEVVKATQAGINSLKGARGSATVDVQGNVTNVAFDTSTVSDPAVKATLESMSSQLGNLSTPFPVEPVGVGARWSVKGSATVSGIKMTTTTRFTLRSRTGDRYELDVAQDAAGVPGPAPFPNLPAGASASITSFNMRSTGQTSGDLTRHLPLKNSNKGAGDGNIEMTVNGQKIRVVQQLTIDTALSPA